MKQDAVAVVIIVLLHMVIMIAVTICSSGGYDCNSSNAKSHKSRSVCPAL